MPICPHCGSYVSEGSPVCSCGATFGRISREEEEEDPEEKRIKEEAKEYYHKGCELKREGKYAMALSMFEKSRELGIHTFSVYEEALFYNEMGHYEMALETLKPFRNTHSYEILQTIAWTLAQLERYDEALELYFKAIGFIEESPRFIQDYSSPQAGIYYTRDELDAQAREKQKLKRKELSKVYAKIGLVYSYQENFKVALKYGNEAIEYGRDIANNWNIRAIILENMGKYEDALKNYEKAIELKNNKAFIENKARLIQKCCENMLYNGEDLEKAYKLISQAIDMLSSIRTDEDIDYYLTLKEEIGRKMN